jgi:iron complex outermembrane receptor protein
VAQNLALSGRVSNGQKGIPYAVIIIDKDGIACVTDSAGFYVLNNIEGGNYNLSISCLGFKTLTQKININNSTTIDFILESAETQLGEFVITGVSKATKIKENPVAINRITIKQIEAATQCNLIDVIQKTTGGVRMLQTGPNISKPFIRGLGYNRVLTLFDGLRQEGQQWGDEHGIEIDAYGMESIEVIKGPASLMYGSDAMAGVISFIPATSDTAYEELHGKITNEYHHNHNMIGNAFYLFQNKKRLSFGLGASHRMAKNYRNRIDGRVYNTGFRELNMSGQAGIRLNKSTIDIRGTIYHNIQGIPDGSRDSLSRRFTMQQLEGELDDVKNRAIVSNAALNSYTPASLHQQIRHYRIYMKHAVDLRKSKLNYLIGFQKNIRKELTHPTNLEQAGLSINLNTVNYHLVYQLPGSEKNTTSIGVNGMWQLNSNGNATSFPLPDYRLFDAGIFATHYHKIKRFTISGGIRYDMRLLRVNDLYTMINPATGFSQRADFSFHPEQVRLYRAFKSNFEGLSGSAGMTFLINQLWHLKFNLSRGYRAPAVNEVSANGLDPGARIVYIGNQQIKPEFSNQQDIGLYFQNKSIHFSISAFNNYIQNYIYLAQQVDEHNIPLIDAQGNRTFSYNQSQANLYGAEVSLVIQPHVLKGYKLTNSFQFVNAYNLNPSFKGKGINGAYLPFIPPALFNTILSRTVEVKRKYLKTILPEFEIEYTAAQHRYLALNETETFTPGYLLLHVSVQITILNSNSKQLNLNLFVNNLLDTAYQSHMSRLKYLEHFRDTRAFASGIWNMGRNAGVKMIYQF